MILLKILALCLSAALICSMLRGAHPQIASAVALGCSAAALMLSVNDISTLSGTLHKLDEMLRKGGGEQLMMAKLCGIALVAELASDICRDAGEAALAKRIDTGVRLGIVASALPAAGRIMDSISELLS